MRVNNSERLIAGIVICDETARLERHGHLPLEPQFFLDDDVGFRESLRRIAVLESEIECKVVAKFGMDERRAWRGSLQLIADRRQSLPFANDKFGRIFGFGAAFGYHHRDRLSLPKCALRDHKTLRRRTMARPIQCHGDKGLALRIDLGCGEDRRDARRAFRRGDVERQEIGMRMGAAYKAGM